MDLKVTCKNCETTNDYGSTRVVDVCEYGVCIEQPKSKIENEDRVNLTVSFFNEPDKDVIIANGVAVWSSGGRVGIEFEEPIEI